MVLHVVLHTLFLHFLFLFHCLERKSFTYLFCSTIMVHILVAFVCNMLSLCLLFCLAAISCELIITSGTEIPLHCKCYVPYLANIMYF